MRRWCVVYLNVARFLNEAIICNPMSSVTRNQQTRKTLNQHLVASTRLKQESCIERLIVLATTVRHSNGKPLLDRHPLLGVTKPKEQNKKQSIATEDRYEVTMKWLSDAIVTSPNESERRAWTELEFVLFLANSTGRRISSIRKLHWGGSLSSPDSVTIIADRLP